MNEENWSPNVVAEAVDNGVFHTEFTRAHDLSMTPAEFLDPFNPIFSDGLVRLAAYTWV